MRKAIYTAIAILLLAGCKGKSNSKNPEYIKTKDAVMVKFEKGTVMQIIRAKTELSEEEFLKKAREREPQFEALPGLIQKYYVKLGQGEYGGIYIWDSAESLKAFKESELAATIPQAYEVIQAPAVEIADILFQLRE
jgi:heme-degrading monooxygenase HmoA